MKNQALRTLFDGELPGAVLFDLDGTLVDSVPDLAAAIDLTLVDVSLPLASVENVRGWVGNGAQVLVQRAVSYAYELASPKMSLVSVDKLNQLAYQRFLYHYGHLPSNKKCSKLYDGVLELLSVLKAQGVLIALVTNKPAQFTPSILAQFSIDSFFDVLVCGDTLDDKKPSPKPLLFASKKLSVSVGQCLMVGDSKNDIQAAQDCGMKCVSVAWGYNYSESIEVLGADLHIQKFDELL